MPPSFALLVPLVLLCMDNVVVSALLNTLKSKRTPQRWPASTALCGPAWGPRGDAVTCVRAVGRGCPQDRTKTAWYSTGRRAGPGGTPANRASCHYASKARWFVHKQIAILLLIPCRGISYLYTVQESETQFTFSTVQYCICTVYSRVHGGL